MGIHADYQIPQYLIPRSPTKCRTVNFKRDELQVKPLAQSPNLHLNSNLPTYLKRMLGRDLFELYTTIDEDAIHDSPDQASEDVAEEKSWEGELRVVDYTRATGTEDFAWDWRAIKVQLLHTVAWGGGDV